MSVRAVLGALQAVAATTVECELTAKFGVDWVPRADGRGTQIKGISQTQLDAYSTRTVQVRKKERELAQAWERKHGREPTSRELLHIANAATLQSRKGKEPGSIDWDALARRWDATLGGDLAGIAPIVSDARGPQAQASEHHADRAPADPPAPEAQTRALAKALTLVSDQHPAWTRHDLIKQLALVLPAETRQMSPEEAQKPLLGLAEEALSGRSGAVVCLEAPQWPPLPASLRRELDGRSVYERPGAARYATTAQLTLQERLVAHAHAQTQAAPRLPGELAARRLGADIAPLEAALHGRAHYTREQPAPRGLRMDQAAAAWHALTSARTVEVITGPAGTGRTRVLAAIARAWDGPVVGTATSQNATNELRAAGVRVTANTTRLLTDLEHGRIPPGALIVADEGSMISFSHLAAIAEYAARNGDKLVLAGDQEQLAAVEGGAMMLLADRLGYVQLAEPVRFTAAWERPPSLRLRTGDATALDEYDQHGRIRGAPPDCAIDQAVRAYVASYLTGRAVLLMAADWARCRELSSRIRDDLVHLGLVDAGPAITIADGAEASAGDLIICRANDHYLEAGEPGRALANGDILRIEAITARGIMVRRLLDSDPATGQRRFTDQAFRYTAYQSSDLAYAVTGHSAQGATVHTGIALVIGTEDRQWLYPAMTRGTDANLAYVCTTPLTPADPQPGTRPAPGLDRYEHIRRERAGFPTAGHAADLGSLDPREPVAVLADVLGRDGAELSAAEIRRRNLANADHLAVLHAIWTAETRSAREERYRELVTAALPDRYRQPLSHQARWLFRTLHAAELAWLDPAEVIRTAVAARDLAGARDIASVLDARIRPRTGRLMPQPQGAWAGRVPQLPDPERRAYLAGIAALMDDRTRRLGQHTAQVAPAWAITALGPVPADTASRRDWERKASPIAAYRETYGYDHPGDPIGPEPTHDAPNQRGAWHQALTALGPASSSGVRAMPDGRLWLLRDTYTAVTAWAPPHTGKELRLARLGAFDAALGARHADTEAVAARKADDHDRAGRHETLAASYRTLRDHYQRREQTLAEAMTDRQEWEHATAGSRRLALAADAELRRRYPGQKIEPLRSVEPTPATGIEREHLHPATDGKPTETAAWIRDLAKQQQASRARIAEQPRLVAPGEDPVWGDLGKVFPGRQASGRDAILQPPKPEIIPSERILQLAGEHDTEPDYEAAD